MNDHDLFSRSRRAGYEPERMHRAIVLVAGAGALGQTTIANLALSGIGELRIVDKDIFEPENRTKSLLFPHHLAGSAKARLPKAQWAATAAAKLMTAPEPIVRYANTWIEDLGAGAFDDVDVVVSCVDSLSARGYLARRALESDRTLISGGFKAERLWYGVYAAGGDPTTRPCWRCGGTPGDGPFSCRHYAADAAEKAIIPAIQTAAATLGGYMAEAAIMHVHGGEPTSRRVTIDLRSGETLLSRPMPDPECGGRHRRIQDSRFVHVHPDQTSLDDLARALPATHLTIWLDAPFVVSAPCRGCRRTAFVNAPLWDWTGAPRCQNCGGPWPRSTAPDELADPEAPMAIRLGDRLAERPLRDLGVRAGDIIFVSADGEDQTLRLGGSALDAFTMAAV